MSKLPVVLPPPLVRKRASVVLKKAAHAKSAPSHVARPTETPAAVKKTVSLSPSALDDGVPRLAVIGTAGRASEGEMTASLWEAMTSHFRDFLAKRDSAGGTHLVSGGAAWSDHVAVWAFNEGLVDGLTLCLPAPFDLETNVFHQAKKFEQSAASAANYHQRNFGKIIQEDTFAQIRKAIDNGATVYEQPHRFGYSPMFARNADIARLATAGVVAFSFGESEPISKGTRNTWNQIKTEPKINVNLNQFIKSD